MGVDTGGAGDQGLMFGYACDETEELMPMPIQLAHRLTQRLSEVRKTRKVDFLRPDGKSQVTVEYRDGKPVRVDCVVISTQHSDTVPNEDLRNAIMEHVIKPIIPAHMLDAKTKYHINPTGRFVIGGPMGDAGLTGRKIIVDTYGGYSRHGGGAFSGKDPSKVDRSACYMARYIAKNVVAAGLASRAEVQLAYAIGVAEPVSVMVDTFGTATIPEEKITALVRENFKLTPKAIIETLDLRRPVYKATAAYGHFGRSGPMVSLGNVLTAPMLCAKPQGSGLKPRSRLAANQVGRSSPSRLIQELSLTTAAESGLPVGRNNSVQPPQRKES